MESPPPPTLNVRLSRLISISYLCFCLVASGLILITVVRVLEFCERAIILRPDLSSSAQPLPSSELYLAKVVSTIAPLASVAAMASPLLQVIHALRHIDEDVHLQWRLFVAIGVSCTLGVVYGCRKGFVAVVVSSLCGLSLQIVNLAAAYKLALRRSNVVSLPAGWVKFRTAHKRAMSMMQCVVFVPLIGIPLLLLVTIGFVIPLDTWLSPIYTICCLLPYIATFSTFPADLRSYRLWFAGDTASGEELWKVSPPGVDLTTLWVMQGANILWATFAILFADMAILTAATVSIVAAGSQLCCFLLPAVVLSFRIYHWRRRLPPSDQMIIADCGWIFIADFSVEKILHPRSSSRSVVEMESLMLSPGEREADKNTRDVFSAGEMGGRDRSTVMTPDPLFSKSHPPKLFVEDAQHSSTRSPNDDF